MIYIPFLFVFPLIDRGTGPWESVRLSARAAWHNSAPLCGMLFVHSLVAALGVCACYAGAVLFMPSTFGGLLTVYHEIFASPVNVPPATFAPAMQILPQQTQRW